VSDPLITHAPHPDATSETEHSSIVYRSGANAKQETELDALAAAYRFILDRHERKKAATASRPNSAKGGSSDSSAKTIIREQP
jgi:hypothetical protein